MSAQKKRFFEAMAAGCSAEEAYRKAYTAAGKSPARIRKETDALAFDFQQRQNPDGHDALFRNAQALLQHCEQTRRQADQSLQQKQFRPVKPDKPDEKIQANKCLTVKSGEKQEAPSAEKPSGQEKKPETGEYLRGEATAAEIIGELSAIALGKGDYADANLTQRVKALELLARRHALLSEADHPEGIAVTLSDEAAEFGV